MEKAQDDLKVPHTLTGKCGLDKPLLKTHHHLDGTKKKTDQSSVRSSGSTTSVGSSSSRTTAFNTDDESDTDCGLHPRDDVTAVDHNNDDEMDSPEVTVAVFFEGTANTLNPVTTQIGIFAESCEAQQVWSPDDIPSLSLPSTSTMSNKSSKSVGSPQQQQQQQVPAVISSKKRYYKMAFDGCGVTDGLSGILFAAGIDRQCDSVVDVVQKIHRQRTSSGATTTAVKVVVVGLSRGGVACLKVAKKLSQRFDVPERSSSSSANNKVDQQKRTTKQQHHRQHGISMSTLLFDPVPGNAVRTGFPYTAAYSMDLRTCRLLRRVLALYPYEPLPDCAMHAPCLVPYHPTTQVEEDVTLGCHQGALFMTSRYPVNIYDMASNLSFRRFEQFFAEEHVPMDYERSFGSKLYRPTIRHCVDLCRRALLDKKLEFPQTVVRHGMHHTVRKAHDRTGQERVIVRRSVDEITCRYLNKHHEQLEQALLLLPQVSWSSVPQRILPQEISSRSNHHDVKIQETYQLDFDLKMAGRRRKPKSGLLCGLDLCD